MPTGQFSEQDVTGKPVQTTPQTGTGQFSASDLAAPMSTNPPGQPTAQPGMLSKAWNYTLPIPGAKTVVDSAAIPLSAVEESIAQSGDEWRKYTGFTNSFLSEAPEWLATAMGGIRQTAAEGAKSVLNPAQLATMKAAEFAPLLNKLPRLGKIIGGALGIAGAGQSAIGALDVAKAVSNSDNQGTEQRLNQASQGMGQVASGLMNMTGNALALYNSWMKSSDITSSGAGKFGLTLLPAGEKEAPQFLESAKNALSDIIDTEQHTGQVKLPAGATDSDKLGFFNKLAQNAQVARQKLFTQRDQMGNQITDDQGTPLWQQEIPDIYQKISDIVQKPYLDMKTGQATGYPMNLTPAQQSSVDSIVPRLFNMDVMNGQSQGPTTVNIFGKDITLQDLQAQYKGKVPAPLLSLFQNTGNTGIEAAEAAHNNIPTMTYGKADDILGSLNAELSNAYSQYGFKQSLAERSDPSIAALKAVTETLRGEFRQAGIDPALMQRAGDLKEVRDAAVKMGDAYARTLQSGAKGLPSQLTTGAIETGARLVRGSSPSAWAASKIALGLSKVAKQAPNQLNDALQMARDERSLGQTTSQVSAIKQARLQMAAKYGIQGTVIGSTNNDLLKVTQPNQ